MQVYDLVMLGVLILTTLFGAWKGLAWQIASISSIFASYFVACQFREPVASVIRAEPPWNLFLAMLVVYLGCSLAIWIAFRLVSDIIDRVKLKEFDRHAGAVVGFTRGVLWCVIITLFAVTLLGQQQQQAIVDSRSGYYIALLLDRAHAVMPEEIHQVLAPYIHSLDERLEPDQRLSHHPGEGSEAGDTGGPDSGSNTLPLGIGSESQQAGDELQQDGDDAIQRWLKKLPEMQLRGR